jgi:putative transposase
MGRPKRITLGGYVYHVLNRANGRLRIFRKDGDFLAFEQVLAEGIELFGMRVCGYCLLSNHWHLLLWPVEDGDLPAFMRWITLTHVQRFHASHGTVGIGHLYQGRYKSFPVQDDNYYLTVMRYIEANPLRAELVKNAADWPWSSFAVRDGRESLFKLSQGPTKLPSNWPKHVHRDIDRRRLETIKNSITRSSPLGDKDWTQTTAIKMNLESTLRQRGRPKKSTGHL